MASDLEFVRSIFAAWSKGDFSSVEWADPDIEFVMLSRIETVEVRGVEDMGREWAAYLSSWSGYQTHCEEILEVEDGALVLTRFHATGKRSGVELDEGWGANLFKIRDGRVVRLVLYEDRARALADVGLGDRA